MKQPHKAGTPISIGIVGCGGIAQVFHIPLLQKHPDASIKALCDIDTSKAAVLADKFGIANVYRDIAEMLQREQLDAVFLLTPNNLHLPMSLIALEYGVHLFIEKPVARNYEEANRLLKKAREVDRVVMVGMQNRFRPDVIAMRQLFEEEELGTLFYLKASWLQTKINNIKQPWLFKKGVAGGGVMLDLGVQLVDLVWYLLGKPVCRSAKALSFNISDKIEVEDTCIATLTFDGNKTLTLEVSWDFPISRDRFQIEAIGEKGTGTLNPLCLVKIWHGQMINISPQLTESKMSYFKSGYQNEVNHFINFLAGRQDRLEASLDDAVEIMRMVDGIYRSIETKKEIYFPGNESAG